MRECMRNEKMLLVATVLIGQSLRVEDVLADERVTRWERNACEVQSKPLEDGPITRINVADDVGGVSRCGRACTFSG